MKTNFIAVDFKPDGSVEAMARDEFPLGFLGNQKITRASEIVFNETTQLWDIHLPTDVNIAVGTPLYRAVPEACGFTSYKQAREVEVAWLEQSRLRGVDPISPRGIWALNVAREVDRASATPQNSEKPQS